MSDSQPTADDYRDRLVDRVLAQALGDERPPDLSSVIAQRVADAQAEVASTTQGRGVMQSRRVWITLLATAASLMVAAFVWQANDHREAAEVARVLVDVSRRSQEAASEGEASELSQQESVDPLSSTASKSASGPTQQDNAAEKKVHTYNLGFSPTAAEKAAMRSQVQILDGPESGPSVANDQRRRYKTGALDEAGDSVAGPTMYMGNYGAFEPDSSDVSQPESKRQLSPSNFFNRKPGTVAGVPIKAVPSTPPATPLPSPYYLTDDVQYYAPEPAKGPFGFGGGGEWPGRVRLNGLSASSDRYEPIHENAFVKPVGEDALSTFSIDVDTASYANVRQYLRDMRQMPSADAVRIEELVNYFDYGYEAPKPENEEPFAANLGCSACPWKPEHKLVRIGVKGREVAVDKRPLSNLVFLVDVSGSMNEENKLPLVVSGLQALVNKLGENDRVAIVVYAGSEGLVLPSTSGEQKDVIRTALDRLTAGGSTAGGAGLRLAYEIAEKNKIVGGVNRVVLCTDGDFNVGMTGTEEIAQFVETRAKETNVYLTVLGFGRGNLNDAMLEQISGRGDGNYAYIDDFKEAHRVLSSDLSKTLVAIAKDVKMQVEFNPKKVASYRLIGYENRVMAAEDFNNDAKDAGDIGAGHTVTALYEVVPIGVEEPAPAVDGLKYQADAAAVEDDAAHVELTADSEEPTAFADELLTLKIRYKQPEGGASKKIEFPLEDGESDKSVAEADADFRWAAAVAEFGMLLRNSRHVGDGSFDAVLELARGAIGDDPQGYRAEFVDLVRRAKEVSGR